MSDKIFLGNQASDMDTGDVFHVTRVNLSVDSDHYYTAGDDTGQTIEVTCPWGTQEMANSILASLQGYQYQPYTAIDALLDPAAEIGDAVTVGGIYSVIANVDTVFDRACAPSISAPESDEIDDEYPYESKDKRETNRQLAQTRSLISKTSEEIMLSVENEIQGLSSSISIQIGSINSQITGLNGQVSTINQTVGSISTQVSGLDSQVSTIEQKVDSITLDVSNGSASSRISLSVDGIQVSSATVRFTGDIVFESDLADGYTLVSGDCIQTGEISARYIRLGGQMDVYESLSSSADVGGYIGYMTGMTSAGGFTSGIAICSYNEAALVICTSAGARMGYDSVSTVVCTGTQVSITGDSVFINGEPQSASDARLKTQVQEDLDRYLPVFDKLRPVTFVYEGHKRRHMGFIAQEIQEALAEEGIPESDFAALCTETPNDERPMGMYSLRYGELQIMTVAKVQDLDRRLKRLEEQYGQG